MKARCHNELTRNNTDKKRIGTIQKNIEFVIADIDKKIEELKNEKKCNAWNPRHGETYYCVGACGNVFDEEFQNRNHDNAHFSIGNYFRTKEDLEKKGFVMVGQTS